MVHRTDLKPLPKRLPVFPYALAMKAYAFAMKPFKRAMENLLILGLETPRQEVESHTIFWDILESMYYKYSIEGRRLSRDYEFTKAQLNDLGIDPFYTWIKEKENPSASYASAFTQDVIDEMQNFRLRQIVSVLLRLEEAPEKILGVLQQQGFTNWRIEHINFYNKFFWKVDEMKNEDWLNYFFISNPYIYGGTDDDGIEWCANPHFSYLKEMVTMQNAEMLRYKCRLPLNSSMNEIDKDIRISLGLTIREILSQNDYKSAAKLIGPYARLTAIQGNSKTDENSTALKESLERITILASPATARRLGVNMADLGVHEPMSIDQIQGTISDPRDTGRNIHLNKDGTFRKQEQS